MDEDLNSIESEFMLEEGMEIEMKLNGREKIEAENAEKIVERMAQMQWPSEKPADVGPLRYMEAVRDRIKIQGGADVRTCCAEHFLEDLAKAGVINLLS